MRRYLLVFRQFKSYKPDVAQRKIQQAIFREIRRNPPSGVQVSFDRSHENFAIEIRGHDQQLVAETKQKMQQLGEDMTKQYLDKIHYQRFVTYDNVQGVKPNHTRIAKQSVPDFKPLKELLIEKAGGKNVRWATNFSLSFVQSIPYSTLESRVTSSGAGFVTPAKLLWENQGDCDSKVTLLSSLLRAQMPRIGIVMVFIEKHALIGIAIPAMPGEATIVHNGFTYVLAEPTGPAMLPLGQNRHRISASD